jgi:hypothetical protein
MSLILSAALSLSLTGAVGIAEDLGQPARARNILTGLLVRDPHSGREVLALSNNNEATGAELMFVDFDDDSVRIFHAPAGAGAEGLTEVPGYRLVLGTFYDGSLMVFDLNTMSFTRSLQFPGQSYVWGFAMGSDGRAYCGTFPGGRLGALDLTTYELEDLGNGAPPNYYLRTVLPTPDGRILCRFLVEASTWLVYDPALKRFEAVPEHLRQVARLAVWKGFLVSGEEIFDGRDFRPVVMRLAFPSSSAVRTARSGRAPGARPAVWQFDTQLTTQKALYIRDGHSLWKYDENLLEFALMTDLDIRGGRFLGATSDGRVLGVRGQDYFVIKPGDTSLALRTIPGESSPRFIFFLRADPQGRVWGGPPYGQTLFWFDPVERKTTNTPAISDNGGEVYDVAFIGNATYAAAYSFGEVIRYDAAQPWDQWGQMNPRTILRLEDRGYGRPTGGIIVGPGQKLYSGWTKASGYGGAIAITDPATERTQLLLNPLGEQQIIGLASDGNLLYVGTGLGGTGLPTKPGELARFGIIDQTRKVVWQQDIDGAERVRPIGYDAATQIVPVIVDAHIRLFDTSTRTFLSRAQNAPPVASWSNGLPGDGKMYYGSAKQVLSLDLRTGAIEVLAETPGYVNNVTVAPDGTIYAGAWSNLYAVRPPGR